MQPYDSTQPRIKLPSGLRVRATSAAAGAHWTAQQAAAFVGRPGPAPAVAMPAREDKTAAFRASQPEVMAWIESASGNEFADSLAAQIRARGSLTERQIDVVKARLDAKRIDVSRLAVAFAHAKASGLDRIRMNLGEFKFKPAARHEGVIYVTGNEDGAYLGKVAGGQFLRTGECTPEQEAAIVAVASDPEGAAVAFGRQTGKCAICKLTLTDAESIARGIGPICAEKFFG